MSVQAGSLALNPRFRPLESFQSSSTSQYQILPFNFIELDPSRTRYLLTNAVGEHIVCRRSELEELASNRLKMHTEFYDNLKARHFLFDSESNTAIDFLGAKFRLQQETMARGTSLFMFVVTLRCEHTCRYCQVSRRTQDKTAFDMSMQHADLAIAFMFKTESPVVKVEFQGGESLLNFELVKFIVIKAKAANERRNKSLAFVITTNLALLTDEHLAFCKEHNVSLSTSLDGPREVHNANRPRPGGDSYARATSGMQRAKDWLGPHAVSALMTTTKKSLAYPTEIVDEYRHQGFTSIFVRPISPYGFAAKAKAARRYEATEWLAFYFSALAYILQLNRGGVFFRESYAALMLRKIHGRSTHYVDLQSPAGIGTGGLVFNYDGAIYASDEGRMLAEMDDQTFRLGHLETDTFDEVMSSDKLWQPLKQSLAEASPSCESCAIRPYCGSEPVFHYTTQGDFCGHKPSSDFCLRNMTIAKHLINLFEDDASTRQILKSWM